MYNKRHHINKSSDHQNLDGFSLVTFIKQSFGDHPNLS